tara:strand:+ start:679 stop:807 length:129 start_codon:yes stop_codon:yes gene_type:complete
MRMLVRDALNGSGESQGEEKFKLGAGRARGKNIGFDKLSGMQ